MRLPAGDDVTLARENVRDGLAHCPSAMWRASFRGAPNNHIAHDLGISPRTIEFYRANLKTKMQAASLLSDLVRMMPIAGILGPNSNGPRPF